MDKKVIFVIDDFHGHGGHVKSFLIQISEVESIIKDKVIICAESGYVQENLSNLKTVTQEHLRLVPLDKLRKSYFSFALYKTIRSELSENTILHVYSPECYFSALFAKSHFRNVVIINSVMGGPNPFSYLNSTDLYIAVSEEQRKYVLLHSNSHDHSKVSIIKNRIRLTKNKRVAVNEDKIVLVISRFDLGMQTSLKRIFSILEMLPDNCSVIVAGTGAIHEEYKKKYQEFHNIKFIGYCNDLMKYKNEAGVVLGMGRSILEFMLHGVPGILVGHNGIELLENIENVEFASYYNFSGRKVLNNIDSSICAQHITSYIENKKPLNNEILTFLKNEYLAVFFKDKYLKELKTAHVSNISYLQVMQEYVFIFTQRIKRKYKGIK